MIVLDNTTHILTNRGYKLPIELTKNDKIGQLNRNGKIVFTEIDYLNKHMSEKEYGIIYRFKDGSSFRVPAMPVKYKNNGWKIPTYVPVQTMEDGIVYKNIPIFDFTNYKDGDVPKMVDSVYGQNIVLAGRRYSKHPGKDPYYHGAFTLMLQVLLWITSWKDNGVFKGGNMKNSRLYSKYMSIIEYMKFKKFLRENRLTYLVTLKTKVIGISSARLRVDAYVTIDDTTVPYELSKIDLEVISLERLEIISDILSNFMSDNTLNVSLNEHQIRTIRAIYTVLGHDSKKVKIDNKWKVVVKELPYKILDTVEVSEVLVGYTEIKVPLDNTIKLAE